MIGLAVILMTLLWSQRATLRSLGLRPTRPFAGCGPLAFFTLLSGSVIALVGISLDTVGQVENFAHWLRRNWYLEGLQQIILMGVVVPRLQAMFRREATVSLVAALLFAMLHLPNIPLTALTLLAGWYWCEWFRKHRNLLALWLSHFALAATTLWFLNGPWLGTLRVGIGYVLRR